MKNLLSATSIVLTLAISPLAFTSASAHDEATKMMQARRTRRRLLTIFNSSIRWLNTTAKELRCSKWRLKKRKVRI